MPEEDLHENHLPTFNQVNAAFVEISEHNRRHTGFGAALANMIMGIVGDLDNEESSAPKPPIQDRMSSHIEESVTEGDMSGELQEILHSDTFMRVGVKLAPFGESIVSGDSERITSTGLVPTLENTELYKEFLESLDPAEVKLEDTGFLLAVIGNLKKVINLSFDPVERKRMPEEFHELAEQYGENALRSFLAIQPEYDRLGLDAKTLKDKYPDPGETHRLEKQGEFHHAVPVKDDPQEQAAIEEAKENHRIANRLALTYEGLDRYVTYWGRNLLPEYIIAERGQYLLEPTSQGFGPAQWHHDGGQRYWRPALEFIAELEQADRTSDFAEEVRQGLVRSLDTAIVECEDPEKYYASQAGDLVNIRQLLTGQPYDQRALEAYTEPPDWMKE